MYRSSKSALYFFNYSTHHYVMDNTGKIREESLLTRTEAAKYLHCSVSFLAHLAGDPDGPPLIKIGRLVLYEKAAVYKWAISHTISVKNSPGRPRKR